MASGLRGGRTADEEHQIKVVLLGDGTTGKTSIATRISQNNFTKRYDQTLGVDFYLRRLELPRGVQVTLQVWDIGGQTVGGSMLENYIYGANAVMFVYDVTNYSSFENLEDWYKETKRVFGENDKPLPYMVLVANKIDLEHMRTVTKDKHIEFAKRHRMISHSLSAKTDDLVYQCFVKVAAGVLNIALSSSDLDTSQKVVRANVTLDEGTVSSPAAVVNTSAGQKNTRSSICSLQ